MRLILLLLVVVAGISADDEWKPKESWEMKGIRVACMEENHVTKTHLELLKTSEFPNEQTFRKYLACIMMNLGVLSTDEGYNADRVAKQFARGMDESDTKKVVEDCINKHPRDDREIDVYVYEMHTCIVNSYMGQ